MQKLEILCVGGTIDKIYFDAKSDYHIGEPMVATIFNKLPLNWQYHVTSLMKKDSLEMSDADRVQVVDAVRASDANYILITHGTDTMTQTAQALKAQIADKTIVITGALQPARFRQTDTDFNLGVAVGALQCLPKGVYVAMNGVVFEADQVRKDVQLGRFVSHVD